jgi:hypothetical protein
LTEGIMNGLRLRFVGLCLPPILFSILDAFLTLMGQSANYWGGDYAQVNEVSPTFNHLLAIHPLAFMAGSAVWLGVVVGFLLLVPDTLALIVSIAVVFGHTVGASSWLLWRFQYGYQFCNGLFLLAAVVWVCRSGMGGERRPWRSIAYPCCRPAGAGYWRRPCSESAYTYSSGRGRPDVRTSRCPGARLRPRHGFSRRSVSAVERQPSFRENTKRKSGRLRVCEHVSKSPCQSMQITPNETLTEASDLLNPREQVAGLP